MPDDEYTDEELGLNTEVVDTLDPNLRDEIRKSRSRLKDAQKWEARAQAAEQQIAVRDVGIDLSKPLGKMFVKAYEGEWTPDAIRAAAADIPGLLPPQIPSGDGDGQADLEAQKRMANAGTSTGSSAMATQEQFLTDLANAKSQEEVMALIDHADPSLGVVRKGVQ